MEQETQSILIHTEVSEVYIGVLSMMSSSSKLFTGQEQLFYLISLATLSLVKTALNREVILDCNSLCVPWWIPIVCRVD